MSADLAIKIRLGLDEFATLKEQMSPLIARTDEPDLPIIETAAACAMLHSFYTEIEKMFKIIAIEFDGSMPTSDSWHRDLLKQMAASTERRPAIVSAGLVLRLSELLAFRHLFRGASIALMRWDKLSPLMAKIDETYVDCSQQINDFLAGLVHAPG